MSDNNFSHDKAELPLQFQLEQRLMFDGAAVSTTADVVGDTVDQDQSTDDAYTNESNSLFVVDNDQFNLAIATEEATQKIRAFMQNASIEDLFAIFNGGLSELDSQWQEAMQSVIQQILDGDQDIQIEILDSETMLLAKAAFSQNGTDDSPVIYLNESLLADGNNEEIMAILIEEFGHYIDTQVNGNVDSKGDEGQSFASIVTGDEAVTRNIVEDHGTLLIDGEYVDVERATYSFVGAYEVDTSRTPAGKETNSHDYIDIDLGAPTIDDNNYDSQYFSGNDVSASAINIDGTTYFGWISRPIKSGGVVRGFYFWTDTDFVDIATAQADGNTDADGDVSDNRGFILVVDQAWFDAQSEVATGIKNVGSSSDRVDSALNALIPSNTAPSATADTGTAGEDGGLNNATLGADAIGNVLSNDSDADAGDSIVVTYAGTSSANQTVPDNGTVDVIGQYGTLTIADDGSYTYTVTSNNSALVEALRTSGDTLVDRFTYSIADNDGTAATTTLAITIEGLNDNPVAANDYDTAKESLRADNTAYDNTDPLGTTATGNVLTNDNDVDGNGETLSIGALEGTIVIDSVTNVAGSVELTFLGESGFNSVSTGQTLYYNDGGTYRALHASNGDLITVSAAPEQDIDVSTTYYVPLTATPAYYLDASLNQVAVGALDSLAVGFKSDTAETTATNSMKTATVSSSQATGTSTIDLTPSNSTGLIAIGMTVSGTGIPAGTLVTDITYNGSNEVVSIELDQTVTATPGGTLSFYATIGTTVSGQYGELVLNADGSYVYTPFKNNVALSDGESGNDIFEYTVLDLAGATHQATLNITVYGSGVNDPNAVADTAIATEAGGVANGTAGSDPSGNILSNDTTPLGTNVVDGARSIGNSLATTIGSNSVINGQYGTLTISSDGSWSYAVDNNNSDVEALRTNLDELEDVFVYTVKNGQTGTGGDLLDSDTLTITIQGANDNPIATDDAATAIEASGTGNALAGYDPTGNVLSNDADVDDLNSALDITAIRTGAVEGAGNAGTVGAALVGTYGTLTMSSDGSWSYAVDNTNSTVNDLAVGETLTDSFNYTVTDGSGADLDDVAVLNITIEGAVDGVAVNNIYVNEASDYAVFTVSGVAGIAVELSLSDTTGLPSGDAKATLGTDTAASNTLEYYDGANWVTYNAGSLPVIPVGGELFVRIAVTQDNVHEGNESFTLVAVTSEGSQASGIGTINDEGEGDIFLEDNVTGIPNGPGDGGYPTLDDDRPTISITDDAVEEGVATEFTVSIDKISIYDVSFSPVLDNGTATIGTDTAAGSTLEVSTNGGGSWSTVSGPVTIAAGQTSIMLRIGTTDDSDVEGSENFTLSTGTISGTVLNPEGVTATATITDNDTDNLPPVAEDNDYATNEDIALTGANIILDADTGTDSDPESDTLNLAEINGTAWASLTDSDDADHLAASGWKMVSLTNGTVYLKSDGSMDYDPDANFHGTDSFTYKISDGELTSDSAATVTITVDSVDDEPTISGDVDTTGTEDTTVGGTLSVTDVDGMTDGTYYTVTTGATNGTATIDPDTGEWSYEPNADYNGSDSFTVTITDDEGHTSTQEIILTIDPVADIADDADTVDEDDTVTTNVLDNDSFEGTPTVTAVTQGTNGTVTIVNAETGEVSYTPNADFNGTDTYTYTVTSGGVTETATVTITVDSVDDEPTISGDISATATEDTTVGGTLSVTDVDGMTDGTYYTVTTGATNGTATIDPDTGEWSYEPNADYNGSDSFTVTITDDEGHTSTQEIILTIDPVADIADDADTVDEDATVITDVLDNDSFEGTPTVTAVTQGTNGTVTIVNAETGEVSYTPNANFNGTDTYTYTVTIGGVTETATVTVTVEPKLQAPVPTPPPAVITTSVVVPPAPAPAEIVETTVAEPVQEEAPDMGFFDLVVQRDIPEQNFTAVNGNIIVDFSIPADTFGFVGNIDPINKITLNAIMLDGANIPDWLTFDADTGRFHGIAPEGFEGTLNIRVIAVDGEGKQVDTIVTININDAGGAASETGLNDQVSSDMNNKGKLAFLDQLEKKTNPEKVVREQMAKAARLLKTASIAS